MKYNKTITLKDGRECILRNGTENDGEAALEVFVITHKETDNLRTYPDEIKYTAEDQRKYLRHKTDSDREIEIIAEVDGRIVGLAGLDPVGSSEKLLHRVDFGISIIKEYWGQGIGRALTDACIECARQAGYTQIELTVVSGNERAVRMYKHAGFEEIGRDPRGFRSRYTGYQELIYMRMELD